MLCGELLDKVGAVRSDLGSWYFRIWLVVVSLLSVLYLVGAGSVMHDALEQTEEDSLRQWFFFDAVQQFPDWRVRVSPKSTDKISSVTCETGNAAGAKVPVAVQGCMAQPQETCRAVRGSLHFGNLLDPHAWPEPSSRRIDCYIEVDHDPATNPSDLAWELDDGIAVGTESYISMWFRARSVAWVLVNPIYVRVWGDSFIRKLWERNMYYHSTTETTHMYHVATVLNSKWSRAVEPWDFFTIPMMLADLGGLYAIMLVILKLIMYGVRNAGIENDSKFLADANAKRVAAAAAVY